VQFWRHYGAKNIRIQWSVKKTHTHTFFLSSHPHPHTHPHTHILSLSLKHTKRVHSNNMWHSFDPLPLCDILHSKITTVDSYCRTNQKKSVFQSLMLLSNMTDSYQKHCSLSFKNQIKFRWHFVPLQCHVLFERPQHNEKENQSHQNINCVHWRISMQITPHFLNRRRWCLKMAHFCQIFDSLGESLW